MTIRQSIIPTDPIRFGEKDALDIESICMFIALGFFWEDTTYYKGLKKLRAATDHVVDETGRLQETKPYFEWRYAPKDISFSQAVEAFEVLFEDMICSNHTDDYTIPISGGLDSRSLVAACSHLKIPFTGYSYSFRNGINEHAFGKKISEKIGFPFQSFYIEPGTLWDYIGHIAVVNECYAEFTHARQFAVYDALKAMGGKFLLGHAGDIFFDGLGLPAEFPASEHLDYVWKKYVKPSGLELATALWQSYGYSGNFTEQLRALLAAKLDSIDIDHPTAKLRSFKIQTYFSKLSCSNIRIFKDFGETYLPYCDDRLIQFVCTVPEEHLDKRKIQIEYIKRRSPKLASVTWQDHRPFNLYNYAYDRPPLNYPYRIYRKLMQHFARVESVRQNWRNQYLGKENLLKLTDFLSDDRGTEAIIPAHLRQTFLQKFIHEDPAYYYHSTTMMITLAAFLRYQHPH
ncbi:MAG: asparagine synthetase B family protein [Bacteroidetes bacterium]|nr:asparagine synthetase B family protein [Bacteroidota bacterium]